MFFMGACGSPVVSLRQIGHAFTLQGTKAEDLVPLIESDAGRATLDYMHQLVAISPPNVLELQFIEVEDFDPAGSGFGGLADHRWQGGLPLSGSVFIRLGDLLLLNLFLSMRLTGR